MKFNKELLKGSTNLLVLSLLEKENMQKALELYEKKYLTAKSINGMLSENGLAYLIAELSRRVGDYQKAHNYFKKVLNDKNIKDEKYIYNLAKKQIENLKEEESKWKQF